MSKRTWIPASKPPSTNLAMLVTAEHRKSGVRHVDMAHFIKGTGWMFRHPGMTDNNWPVLAWRHMPEPARDEDIEND